MKKQIFKNMLNWILSGYVTVLTIAFSNKALAQDNNFFNSNPPPNVMVVYGGPPLGPSDFGWWVQIFVILVLPLAVIISLIVGIVVLIKRKLRKNAQKNSENRQAKNMDIPSGDIKK